MTTATAIAAYYEIPLGQYRDLIYSALVQSRENAGINGKSRRQYFDGYMLDYIFENGCSDRELSRFHADH